MNNIKGALGKATGASYGSNRDVDDLYSTYYEEFESDNPLKVSPLTRDEEEMLEKSEAKTDNRIGSGDSGDSNEEQQPVSLIQITDPNHFSPPPQRMQQFKGGSIDVSQPVSTIAQRSAEAAASTKPGSLPKSPFSAKAEITVYDVNGKGVGDAGTESSQVDNGADASSGNTSPGSPDFLRKMTSWFERSKNSPAVSTLRKSSVSKEAKNSQEVVSVGTNDQSGEIVVEEPTMGDIYTERGIVGRNPMLQNESKATKGKDPHNTAPNDKTVSGGVSINSSTDIAVTSRENDISNSKDSNAVDDDANCNQRKGIGSDVTSDMNTKEPATPVTSGSYVDEKLYNDGSVGHSSTKKSVTFVIPARPDVYTYENEGLDSPDKDRMSDDDMESDNNLDEYEDDEVVGMAELHPEPENTKLNSSIMSVSDYISDNSPIPDDSNAQYPRLESPKQLRFALNVRFSDETGGELEQYYQNPLLPSSPSSTTSSDRSRSPEMERGFESANGRLQRFKQLILQASLRKQKMIFSPSKKRSNNIQTGRRNQKGSMRIPASDTKASVLARSRRYDEIVRREEAQLSKPLAELCWDNSPANQDFRRATRANRHYWNQVRMLSVNENQSKNFHEMGQDHDEGTNDEDGVNDDARDSDGELCADDIRSHAEVESDSDNDDLGSTSRNLFINKEFVGDDYTKSDDIGESKNAVCLNDGDKKAITAIDPSHVDDIENEMNIINCKEDTKDLMSCGETKLQIQTSFDSWGENSLPGSLEYPLTDNLDDVDSELDLQLGDVRRLPVSQSMTSPKYLAYANMLQSDEFKAQLQARQATPAKTEMPPSLSSSSPIFPQSPPTNASDTVAATPEVGINFALDVVPANQASPWTSVIFTGEDDRRRARSSTFESFDDGRDKFSIDNTQRVKETHIYEESTMTSESIVEFQEDENCLIDDTKGDDMKTNQETATKKTKKKVSPKKNPLKVKGISSSANNGRKDNNKESNDNTLDVALAADEENKEHVAAAAAATDNVPLPSTNKTKIRRVVPFNGSHFTSGLPPLRRLGQKTPPKIEVEPIEIDEDEAQAWQPVTHHETGKIYYWNSLTNETTAVGVPDPNRFRIKTISSPDIRQDSPTRTNLYHEDTSHISPTYPYPSDMMKKREKLFDPSYTRFFNQRLANVEKPRSPISSNFRKPIRKYDYTGRVNPRSVSDFPGVPDMPSVNIIEKKNPRKNSDDYANTRGLSTPLVGTRTIISNQENQLQQIAPQKVKAPLSKSVQIKLSKTQKIIQEKRKLEAKKEKREKNKMYW